MKKLNNKGFVISSVLYTLLISFILVLALLLLQFKSSSDVINNASKDLVSGKDLVAKQVQISDASKPCILPSILSTDPDRAITGSNHSSYTSYNFSSNPDPNYWIKSDKIIQIFVKGKTYYWPRDFEVYFLRLYPKGHANEGLNIMYDSANDYGGKSFDKRLTILWCNTNTDPINLLNGSNCTNDDEYIVDGAKYYKTTRTGLINDSITGQSTKFTLTVPTGVCCEEDPDNKGHCKP